MASIPKPQNGQISLTADRVTPLIEINSASSVGTAAINVFNASGEVSLLTVWFVPAGAMEPRDEHLICEDYPMNAKASFTTFGVAVSAGDRFFVKANRDRVIAFANILNHLDA